MNANLILLTVVGNRVQERSKYWIIIICIKSRSTTETYSATFANKLNEAGAWLFHSARPYYEVNCQ